jgi:osmoprotectant transport system substrate-binding protein
MTRIHRRRRLGLAALAATSLLLGACQIQIGEASEPVRKGSKVGDGGPIVIASFNFAESQTLAEVYSQALEENGFPTEVMHAVGSKEIVEPALQQGIVDFVLDYQGTALEFVTLNAEYAPLTDEQTYRQLRDIMEPRGVSVLDYAPGENKNEVVVTRATAERYDLKKISDLQSLAPDMILGGPPECPTRTLCLLGLEDEYGLAFAEFRSLDTGGPVTVDALKSGEIDVGILFTTNPAIPANDLVTLQDDEGLQPHENIVPVVRTVVVDVYGEDLVSVVDSVTEKLTTDALRNLNERVELFGATPEAAARAWLRLQRLIGSRTSGARG